MDDTASAAAVAAPPDPTVPLALQTRWACGDVIGRATELSAIRQELASASRGMLAAVTFEGEPGIGKSRLLVAASDMATERGFATVAVTADEELRGPFLVARSILGDRVAHQAAGGAASGDLLRALDAISGRDDPGLDGLSPDDKLLRVFDLGAVAIRTLASRVPVAMLLDDLQWADEDSLRMLRYIVRAASETPLFMAFTLRPEELIGSEAVPLLADMERLGMVRRLRIGRLTQIESAELVHSALGSPVDPSSAATIHAQAEGVPFILLEVARTYREAGLIQQIDGVWTLARNAERLVPSAVRTLIQRRAARLPATTRGVLAEAAVVGRAFSVRDVVAVKERLGDTDVPTSAELADLLSPAVAAGLLIELPAGAPADYRFAHEQVREFAAVSLTPPRRRAIHGALVDLMTGDVEPPPESLPLLAQHALASGDTERSARFSIDAAAAALAARAPEEVLRVVDLALPVVSTPPDRVALLTARDDALGMVRRPEERIEGLAELAALAEALGDAHLELEVMLRRAAALRLSGEEDRAVELSTEVRGLAAARGDRRAELDACLELGQAYVGRPLGESYSPSPNEVDLDAADEAYSCACDLARELGRTAALAAAERELGVIEVGRVRAWLVDFKAAGGFPEILSRVAAGEELDDIILGSEIAPTMRRATEHFERAIELFEQLGDRRGLMSSIIAMAYLKLGPDIHLQASAKRIEEIRHLSTQMLSLSRESERDRAEAQMLYGVHVFARAKVVPDLALSRGAEAHEKAHLLGDRSLEFVAAGGVAMVHLDLGDIVEAERWADRAAAAAAGAPTPFKARQLALWRGTCFAAAGRSDLMLEQLEHALRLATEQGRAAARCEALARLALSAAQLGATNGDEELLTRAERAAADAQALVRSLPGHPLWGARADAALIRVALARGDHDRATEAARRAARALAAADLEDLNIDIRVPIARALLAGGTEHEQQRVHQELRLGLTLIAQRIVDEEIRVRWFRGPLGRELTDLVGEIDAAGIGPGAGSGTVDEEDARLLRLLVEGRTNQQIADVLGVDAPTLERQLAEFYARIGTGSRAGATTFAFRERVV